MRTARLPILVLVVSIVVASGTFPESGAEEDAAALPSEVREALGDGVVGALQAALPVSNPISLARWEPGEWTYRITAGDRQGQTEREILAPIDATTRGETWRRTIGREYTLYVSQTAQGSLVMPSEVAHAHKALVYFDPPLFYLSAAQRPGEVSVFDGQMEVYRARDPSSHLYSGRIRAATTNAGVYRLRTPAGTFDATLIKTNYKIDIFAVVSVTDALYTFYADGVGKVAEAEHRRISMIAMFNSDTEIGKVLVAFKSVGPTLTVPPPGVQAP